MTQAVLYNHTATLLEDGRVLVTGGQTTERAQRGIADSPPPPAGVVSAEIYDPSTGSWSPTRPMLDPRRYHGAVRLEDGRVLVSGGLTDEYKVNLVSGNMYWVGSIASAEVYDPSTETWSRVGEMSEETVRQAAWQYNNPTILLERQDTGKVLAVGGLGPSAAVYDPSSGTWASFGGPAASSESPKREWHTSALLGSGMVLYIGGSGESRRRNSVDLYEPLTGSVSRTGSMTTRRSRPTATVLADGRVLVTGGRTEAGTASPEIYDPLSGTWSRAGQMAAPRLLHTMTVLSDGRVLVVGGGGNATEIYDPSTGIWSKAADTIEDREGHTATLLEDGRVLVAGGASGSGGQPFPTTSAEVYDPVADTWTPSTEVAQ